MVVVICNEKHRYANLHFYSDFNMIFVFAKAFISIFLDFNLFPLETDFEIFSIFCLFSKFKATQRKKNIKLWMHISGKATLSPFLQIMFKEKVV